MSAAPPSVAPGAPISTARSLGPWYAAEFVLSFAATLFGSCVYYYAQAQLGATPSQRLWLSAGWGAGYVFISLLAGYWSEKWGPRLLAVRMATLSLFTGCAGLLVIYWPPAHNLIGLIIAMTLFNFTASQLWPAIESAITRSPGRLRLGTRVAGYNLIWGSSNALAFFVGPLVNAADWRLIFIIPAVGMFIGGIMIQLSTLPQSVLGAHHVPAEGSHHDMEPALQRRNTALLHMAWVANGMAYVTIYVLIAALPTLVRVAHAQPGLQTSVLNSAWTWTRFIGFFLMWRWTGWHYSSRWLIATFLLMAGSFVVMVTMAGNVPILLASQIVFGLAIALFYSASLYYAMHVSAGAGGHAGMHEALIGVGVAVGPAAAALAGTGDTQGGVTTAITATVSALLAAGLLTLLIMAKRQRAAETRP